VTATPHRTAEAVPGGPRVRLLDARDAGVDEAGLRALGRAESAASGAPHSCRSYRFPYALVAWHSAPVGVDIERAEPLGADFVASISTPAEQGQVPPGADPDIYPASLWCSKEALSKALGDALEYDPRRLDSPIFWPGGEAGPWRALALAAPAGHVAWLCWRTGQP
jgi:hypothetical protein